VAGPAQLDAWRIHPTENTTAVAVERIWGLVSRLPVGSTPLFVFDAGYDSTHMT
jgi:hypothetical protein